MLDETLPVPETALDEWLKSIPSSAAVFCLFGHDPESLPYISKSANLRRRLRRLLTLPTGGKRLHLAGRIARVAWSESGSAFQTALLLLDANRKFYGESATKRLHLRPPVLLRFASENPYPRVYVTNRISRRALDSTYGPFPTRVEAERFLDDSLNFFLLRRCIPNLDPDPAFPGCVYSEMNMCLAPCFRGCTDERYALETQRVREYLETRGAATISRMEKEREELSAALDFESAAQLHQRIEKMKSVAQRAAPLVHSIANLRAIVLQPAARAQESGHVAVFLVHRGRVLGPGLYSVEGMRHPNERSGSTSLFAHPMRIAPVPLASAAGSAGSAATTATRESPGGGSLQQRLLEILDTLEKQAGIAPPTPDSISEHLSLLARWYYRPPSRRTGEIFFREPDGFPLSRVLRGISRVFRGQPDLQPGGVKA